MTISATGRRLTALAITTRRGSRLPHFPIGGTAGRRARTTALVSATRRAGIRAAARGLLAGLAVTSRRGRRPARLTITATGRRLANLAIATRCSNRLSRSRIPPTAGCDGLTATLVAATRRVITTIGAAGGSMARFTTAIRAPISLTAVGAVAGSVVPTWSTTRVARHSAWINSGCATGMAVGARVRLSATGAWLGHPVGAVRCGGSLLMLRTRLATSRSRGVPTRDLPGIAVTARVTVRLAIAVHARSLARTTFAA